MLLRDEEKIVSDAVERGAEPREFYKTQIYPYKGKVEMWYQDNKSLWVDILIIFLTAWVIVFSKSNLPYKVFKTIPPRPSQFDV